MAMSPLSMLLEHRKIPREGKMGLFSGNREKCVWASHCQIANDGQIECKRGRGVHVESFPHKRV